MSKIKFILSESEYLDHRNSTKYLLTFKLLEQDMEHSKKIKEYITKSGIRIRYAYPYICQLKRSGYIYLRSVSDHDIENKNRITSDSFDSKEERNIYKIRLIDALKEWSEKK